MMSSKNFHKSVGEISCLSERVYWTISNFNDLANNYCYRSPTFDFKDSMWRLLLWKSKEWLDMGFELLSLISDRQIVKFGVQGSSLEISKTLEINDLPHKCPMIHCSALKSQGKDWIPDGDLSLFFAIGDGDEAVPRCQMKKEIENKDCERTDQTTIEACTQTEGENGIQKLQQDFKEFLLSGNVSDVILKVDDEEVNAHKCILAARSPIFLTMMMNETEKKGKDIWIIEDTDPNTFPEFLNYLYTGCVENQTLESVLKLYITAEKYQVNELKNFCTDYMLKNISAENFCDIFNLSLKCDEKDLMRACHQFFANNSLAIILTSKWKTFLREKPMEGNELFIRHFQNNT